jgi:hypothetical protein
MLPFLKKSQDASASAPTDKQVRKPDEDKEQEYDVIESAAEDLISAVHSKDVKAACAALRAAFELMDSQPHVEGPHE